jgi:hypothetical protein
MASDGAEGIDQGLECTPRAETVANQLPGVLVLTFWKRRQLR